MSPLLIALAVFVGVSAAVGGVAIMFRDPAETKLDDRLTSFTTAAHAKDQKESSLQVLLHEGQGFFERLMRRLGRLKLLFEQADTNLKPAQFFGLSGALAVLGWLGAMFGRAPLALCPVVAIAASMLPLLWLIFRRKRRLKVFQAQLPDALELLGRALRAGHSLGAGFNLVADEMPAPIGKECERVFEETNLGVTLEDALLDMTDRVPNLDLRFFVTAVILQRQTGGDLAEILDKISHLIRERFKIWGQVQALTGEGRLSGIVLLALPPALFMAVYRLNPEYVLTLFNDPLGTKMLAGAVVLQLLGAVVIKKIINIKV